MSPPTDTRLIVEKVARVSYGRLLAFLVSRFRDLQRAEDALSDALVTALDRWPKEGVPSSPEGWILTVAKRNLLMLSRHDRVEDAFARATLEAPLEDEEAPSTFPDERLRMLFLCAHASVEPSMRMPLMLQVVLGLEAKQIAAALLVSPSAMAQRLVRTKARLNGEEISFEIPSGDELESKLFSVLETIYAAYGLALDGIMITGAAAAEMREEALYLVELVVSLLPNEPEPMGLLALILFCESRSRARISDAGDFVPLHAQDTSRWNTAQILSAEQWLSRASSLRRPGPLQLEAAIQSAHSQRAATGVVPWWGIAELYSSLVSFAPTVGARVAQAIAVGESEGPSQGLRLLDALERDEPKRINSHQPFWVARAELSFRSQDFSLAKGSMIRAIGLSDRSEIRAYLIARAAYFDSRAVPRASVDD